MERNPCRSVISEQYPLKVIIDENDAMSRLFTKPAMCILNNTHAPRKLLIIKKLEAKQIRVD